MIGATSPVDDEAQTLCLGFGKRLGHGVDAEEHEKLDLLRLDFFPVQEAWPERQSDRRETGTV
eukprot:917967-Rhodomonas_salina.2